MGKYINIKYQNQTAFINLLNLCDQKFISALTISQGLGLGAGQSMGQGMGQGLGLGMSKLSKIIKTTIKESIIVIINCPIVSSLDIRISANGLFCLTHVFFTIIKFYNNEMYPCLPIRLSALLFFTIMKFTILKCNHSLIRRLKSSRITDLVKTS